MKGTITMSNKEVNRSAILERLNNKSIKQKQAGLMLGLSTRQVRRLLKKYRREGVSGLVHGNRGKVSNRKIPAKVIDQVEIIIAKTYSDFGPTLASEKLEENHQIKLSGETVRQIMTEAGLWRVKRRRMIRIHPMRDRRECEGELVQIDGSPHHWLEDRGPYCDLILYIDDATSKIKWAEFSLGETTKAYFKVSKQYLEKYGKPLAFYCDKNSIFRINTKRGGSSATSDSNGLTQFGRAMKQLDIELIYAHSPQAKGRVERANLTLQDRLVKEMRLKNIGSLEEANQFLPSFVEKFNSRFAVEPKQRKNLHQPLLPGENLEKIFCLIETRVLSKNLTCQYKNKLYQIKTNRPAYAMRNAPVLVRENMKGMVTIEYKGKELEYSIVKKYPRARIVDIKQINPLVDQIKTSKIPWKPVKDHVWGQFTI